MKNRLLTVLMLLAMIVVVASSCTTQRNGCPGNPQASTKFRG